MSALKAENVHKASRAPTSIISDTVRDKHSSTELKQLNRLIDAVSQIAPVLREGSLPSDSEGRLAETSVKLLKQHDLWRLRLCSDLGGLELSIVDQIDILAALSAQDASAAWCTMIVNNAVAIIGATMPAAAVEQVFSDGVPVCSIVATPGGVASEVEGGYTLTGTWGLASAIHHADWIHAIAFVDRDPSRPLAFVVPARDVEILDTWDVVGLSGTGSNDFRLDSYFLPAALTGHEGQPFEQIRGLRRYDCVDVEHLGSYEHLAFAIGIARRSLSELRQIMAQPPAGRHLADREVVQEQFGRSLLRLHAVEALSRTLYQRIDAAALGAPQSWLASERHLPRTLAAQASELALECVQLAFRRAGFASLHRANIYEKLMRDMSVAGTHVVVDDSAFACYAQHVIETGDPFLSNSAKSIQ
jgi:indole-3-acetate monooxygenase